MKVKSSAILSFLIILLFISSVFASPANKYLAQNSYSLAIEEIESIIFPKSISLSDEDSIYLTKSTPNMNPLGGSQLDQQQILANCWYGTSYFVTKTAQRFKPTLDFLDDVKLKIWRTFTIPNIDVVFYIYDNNGNIPGSLISGGISETYSSSDFLYQPLEDVPNPMNDNDCPWERIEFPYDPQLNIGSTYWIVMDISSQLEEGKHVFLAGYDGDVYPDGHIAWYSDEYGWQYDFDEFDCDLMFKTYGYTSDVNPPTADAGGPYYGYMGGGETIIFDGSDSYDNDEGGNSIDRYDWKFYLDDSWNNDIGHSPSHIYSDHGTYEVILRVYDDEEETDTGITTVTIYPPGPPHVNFVETYYADGSEASNGLGLLLQGMNLSNTYTASVSGAGVDRVQFELGLQSHTDDNGGDGWTATFNSEDILNPFAELKVKAHNQHGWGEEIVYQPRIIPVVGWLVQFVDYVMNYNETDFASFSVGINEDPPLSKNNFWTLEASFDFSFGSPENTDESPVDAGVDVPVDDVGGDYGYSGGIGSSVIVSSDGSIDVSGGFEATLSVKNINGKIGASIYGSLTVSDGIIWDYMYLTIYGEVAIPVFYLPLEVCGIGIEAGVDITPHVEIKFNLDPSMDSSGIVPFLGIKIKEDEGIEGNVGARVRAYAEVGFVIGEFYTEAGGDGTLYFQTPSPPGYFKDFVLSCWIGGRLRLLFWTIEGWWEYEWSYLGGRPIGAEYHETEWGSIERDYINPDDGEYNEFVWNEHTVDKTLIRNSFPYANPNIANFPESSGNKVMIVWSHDDADKPRIEGMEIQYAIWEREEGMSIPQNIPGTNDDKLQMDPQIAFDQNGNVVCVLVQTDDSISENSNINEVCNATEIAYIIWDKDTQTWSSISAVTNNDRMDVSPQLISDSEGNVVLIWTSDNDNNHITIDDRSIFATFWDGGGWSEVCIIAENMSIISTPQVAVGGDRGEVICVFTMDEDSNSSTPSDQNIFYTTFSESGPSNDIIQFTEDYEYQNTAPSVTYGQDGNPYIIWIKNRHELVENEEIYNGTLYYKRIGSDRDEEYAITSGAISDPIAIQSHSTAKFEDDFIFAVGWCGKSTSQTLNVAKINSDHEVESGVIYGSKVKLSEVDWNIAPGSITATTIERPVLKENGKNCNLSFISAPGFDTISPVTDCQLDGEIICYGGYGPIYKDNVTICLDATDDGGSGVDTIYYRLDWSSWQEYDGSLLMIQERTPHVLEYYSIDKAENEENVIPIIFEIVETRAPEIPFRPWGPTSGKAGEEYFYYSRTTDPDRDPVYYMWDWGDDIDDWIGPYYSGEVCAESHTWDIMGDYEIQVKSRDVYGIESDWSDLFPVSMPQGLSLALFSCWYADNYGGWII